jgi:hydrogenase expression/formation protein HypC
LVLDNIIRKEIGVTMCLAIPGKIIRIDKKKQTAIVDYGSGTQRNANVSLVTARIGDYVLVHAGFAIQVLDEKEAQETLALFREMLSAAEGG